MELKDVTRYESFSELDETVDPTIAAKAQMLEDAGLNPEEFIDIDSL